MTKSKEVAFLGIFLALTLIFSYIERMIPSPIPAVPGIKLGLANAIIIILLYLKDAKTAFSINLLRIIANGVLFSGPWGMLYSLSGAMLSFIMMLIFKKTKLFGIVGVSVIGGVFHNIGQILVAVLILENIKLFYYVPVLIISGIITGVLIGFVSGNCIIRLRNVK